jgi:CRP-like cAMP-binding protein
MERRIVMALEKLEKHELFGLLNETEMAMLANASGVMRLVEGEVVCREGNPAGHFFVLLKGRVELTKANPEGPSHLVDDLLPGSIFGVSSVMNSARYFLDGVCVEDSEVLKIEGRALRRVLDMNLTVGYAMQRRLSQIFFKRFVDAMERVQAAAQTAPMAYA